MGAALYYRHQAAKARRLASRAVCLRISAARSSVTLDVKRMLSY
jgi:hypothetical protein